MAEVWVKLSVSPEVKEKVMVHCYNDHIKHNPNLKGLHLSEKYMVNMLAEFYLRAKVW